MLRETDSKLNPQKKTNNEIMDLRDLDCKR